MKIIIGSSFWLFGLAVILNLIGSSLQSGNPGRPVQGARIPGIFSRQGFHAGYLPFRKVRCPRRDQVTIQSSFMMKDAQGSYEECTPDKILVAIGSFIVGHLMNDRLHPISGVRGTEIIYDEATDRQIVAGIGWLQMHCGLYQPLPQETLRSNVIDDFGLHSPNRNREPIRPPGPDVRDVDSDAGSLFDSDSDSSSTSSFSRSSSFASDRSSRPGSPGKK